MSGDEYYPYPWQVVYSQRQIRWLLKPEAWNVIKAGQWPFSIKDDALIRAGISHHAAFELISLVKAELEMRLESVDKDGYLCLARYYNEWSDEQIARAYNVPVQRVSQRIRRAMRYMAGRERKSISYDEWIKNGWSETPRPQKHACVF